LTALQKIGTDQTAQSLKRFSEDPLFATRVARIRLLVIDTISAIERRLKRSIDRQSLMRIPGKSYISLLRPAETAGTSTDAPSTLLRTSDDSDRFDALG